MAVTLELTERQAEYLNDILDMWIEETAESLKEVTREDSIIQSAEEMLIMHDQINWSYADAVDLKLKLMEARR